MEAVWAGTQVLRDPGKPVGICLDRQIRLNMTWRPIVKQYREGKVKSMPMRQVKKNLKPHAYKHSEGYGRKAMPDGVPIEE